MAVSRKRIKDICFPAAVLSVKETLQKTNDPRLETMRLLTETRSGEIYMHDLKRMWYRLAEYRGGFGVENDDLWVQGFLNAADKIRKLPRHFYMSDEDRDGLIARIKFSTKELVNIHNAHNFSKKNVGEVSFVDALKSMAEHTIIELEDASIEGKSGKNVYAIRLIRLLARHHEIMFGESLNSVLKTAALAIYGAVYSDQDISNHLHR